MSNLIDKVSQAARYLARPFVSLYRWLIAGRRRRTSPSAVQQPQPAIDLLLDEYSRALIPYSGMVSGCSFEMLLRTCGLQSSDLDCQHAARLPTD
jgi:hypothetical protein